MSTHKPARPIRLLTALPEPARGHQPLTYSIDVALGVIFVDLLAIDHATSVIQALQQVRLNPSFKRGLSACIDCGCLDGATRADDIRALAELWRRNAARGLTGRCAIIAPSARAYRDAQAFVALAKVRISRVRVFSRCADALVWLCAGRKSQQRREPTASPRSGRASMDDSAPPESTIRPAP